MRFLNFRKSTKTSDNFIRNFIFGVEDSLVSTVGLLSGVTIAGTARSTIILSGIVLIFVEAFAMGVGSFLSEHSVFKDGDHNSTSHSILIKSSLIMFFSYFLAGFIPLFPYLVFEPRVAFNISISLSLLSLFALGLVSAKRFNHGYLKKGLEMLIIGGIAIGIGVAVGSFVHYLV